MLIGLVSRADLVGKCVVVKSFDSASSRYAVCIDASGEMVKALEGNLLTSIFVPDGGCGRRPAPSVRFRVLRGAGQYVSGVWFTHGQNLVQSALA